MISRSTLMVEPRNHFLDGFHNVGLAPIFVPWSHDDAVVIMNIFMDT